MAEKTFGTIVTDIGVIKISQAMMEGTKINVTKFAVGDGNGAYYQPQSTMTALKREVWRGEISSVSINENSPNMIDIVAVIGSNVGGFTIREMGIIDEENKLIAICNTPDTEKVIITSGAAAEMTLVMHIEVSNTATIKFLIDPSVITATKKDIKEHNESRNAHTELFSNTVKTSELDAHKNNGEIHVTAEQIRNYGTAIGELVQHATNENRHVTTDDKKRWDTGVTTANEVYVLVAALNEKSNQLENRITRIEDGLFNNITANPFLVTFNNLSGINLVKGVWNKDKQRIEC